MVLLAFFYTVQAVALWTFQALEFLFDLDIKILAANIARFLFKTLAFSTKRALTPRSDVGFDKVVAFVVAVLSAPLTEVSIFERLLDFDAGQANIVFKGVVGAVQTAADAL